MSTSPAVTIITRVRHRHLFLRRAAESVLGQTYRDWEHIFVNDNGNPDLLENGLNFFRDRYGERLITLHRSADPGMQQASNEALGQARGRYVVIHDDDDAWHPRFLEHAVAHLDAQPDHLGVAVQTTRIFEAITADGYAHEVGRDAYQPFRHLSLRDAARRNPFPPIAFLYRRSVHESLGLFDPSFNVLGDWEFHLRVLLAGEIGVIPHPLAYYFWRTTSSAPGFGNTVTQELDEHRRQKQHLINTLLRRAPSSASVILAAEMEALEAKEKKATADRATDDRLARVEGRVEKIHQRLRRWEALFTFNWSRLRAESSRSLSPAILPLELPGKPALIQDPEEVFQEWQAHLPQAEVISLDLFDTAFRRRLQHYRQVFLIWEKALQSLSLPGYATYPWAQSRLWAESFVRRKHPVQEPNLDEIHACLAEWARRAGVDYNAAAGMEEELKVEKNLLFLRPAFLRFLKAARDSGKPVVYLSDMYLSSEVLQEWCDSLNLPKGRIWVSNEAGASKEAGTLFPLVAQELGVSPDRILHLGDNHHSDVTQARTRGWRAVHLPTTTRGLRWDEAQPYHVYYPDDLLGSALYGVVREGIAQFSPDAIGERFGFEVVGPLHYAFLAAIARQQKVRAGAKVWFLARDGYDLQQHWSHVANAAGIAPNSAYLLASRRLLNFPTLELHTPEAIDFLVTPNPGLCGRDLFLRLGIDPAEIEPVWRAEGLPAMSTELTTPQGVYREESLHWGVRRVMEKLIPLLREKQNQERAALAAYFAQEDLSRETAEAGFFVDVGWQASSLLSLQRFFSSKGDPVTLEGYYFATWPTAQRAQAEGCRFDSWFAHLGVPESRGHLLQESVGLIENCFTAPHGSIVSLRQAENGSWEAVTAATTPAETATADLRQKINEGARAFWSAMQGHWKELPSGDGFTYLEPVLHRTLRCPTPEEAKILGALPHQESFGGPVGRTHLAKVPGDRSPQSLRAAYEVSAWRKGFTAQLLESELNSQGA